jgi:putative DNA primase/helicase
MKNNVHPRARKPNASVFADAPSLSDFNRDRRWVGWREENGRKVPKSPMTGRNADCIGSLSDWGTRAEAEQRARRIGGGVGFILGPLGFGQDISGIDLDGCLDESGALTDKAREVIERFNTYAEKSPSGYGVKLFFLARRADLAAVCPGKRKTFSGVGEHNEIALDIQRYYTVTDEKLRGSGTKLRLVSRADLEWLVHDLGPRFSGVGNTNTTTSGRDDTGSGHGRRFFKERRGKGEDYDTARAAILIDQGRAGDWARKSTTDERQPRRAWEAAEESVPKRTKEAPATSLDVVRMSSITSKAVSWVWRNRLARGHITILSGHKGLGKSQIGAYITGRVTTGRQWVDGDMAPFGSVLVLSLETSTYSVVTVCVGG